MPATAAMAKANDIEICYEMFGDASAPPLFLIMGLGAQMIVWDDLFCTQLAERGFHVIRFDNRDVGLTTNFDNAGLPRMNRLMEAQAKGEAMEVPYKLVDMAADSVGLLDTLKINSAHIVGVSMGGMIAQTIAIHHPNRIRTLTSIMSNTGEQGIGPTDPEVLKVLYTPTPTDRAGFIENYVKTRKLIGGKGFPINEERERDVAGRIFERGVNPAGVTRQFAAIMASGSRNEALKSLKVPTLVIHGDEDPLVPVAGGIATAKAIPGARLLIVKGMGHGLPAPVWPQIIEAIAGHAVVDS
ncbi:MAG: alpha/beta hydrolase [Deltaproteobacteria bacterium RBG_13_43_22]|nr:MAG: alpha/beta hydrolase [Deltaproteobacteria bacterium RBG_13_43_22]